MVVTATWITANTFVTTDVVPAVPFDATIDGVDYVAVSETPLDPFILYEVEMAP